MTQKEFFLEALAELAAWTRVPVYDEMNFGKSLTCLNWEILGDVWKLLHFTSVLFDFIFYYGSAKPCIEMLMTLIPVPIW